MTDDTAIQMAHVIARAINDGAFLIWAGIMVHAFITMLKGWEK